MPVTEYESIPVTPEEDKAFQALSEAMDKNDPLTTQGRAIERLGKLLQDKNSSVVSLVIAAADAGFVLHFNITGADGKKPVSFPERVKLTPGYHKFKTPGGFVPFGDKGDDHA